MQPSNRVQLPKDMWLYGVGKFLLEIDKQILRRVNRELKKHYKYQRIEIIDCDMEFVHINRYWGLCNNHVAMNMASRGRIECLEFLYSIGVEVNYDVAFTAIEAGHLDCLKYLVQQGCIFGEKSMFTAIHKNYLHILIYLHTTMKWNLSEFYVTVATAKGSLQCLQYMIENGADKNKILSQAVRSKQFACFVYGHEIGSRWSKEITTSVAGLGYLEFLQYACENGSPYDHSIIDTAIIRGHLECVMYLHSKGCRVDIKSIITVVQLGHYSCLVYLHENGYILNDDLMYVAFVHNQLEILRYLHQIGCKWNRMISRHNLQAANIRCLEYLQENGLY